MSDIHDFKPRNGLRTKMFKRNSSVVTKAYCITKTGKEFSYFLPAESAYCWYPLFPYYNYYYLPDYHDILLVFDNQAPKYVKDNLSDRHIHLKDMFDYKSGNPKLKNNIIMNTNLGLEEKFKSQGMVTWNMPYSKKDIEDNYKKINNTIDIINENILSRQDQHREDSYNYHTIDVNTYNYANDSELNKLLEMGCALNMNKYMKKVNDVIIS